MQIGTDYVARDLGQMPMVREEQHLRRGREFRKNLEAGKRPIIVEIDKQVVRQKGHADALGDRLLRRREPQRQEELIGGAVAHGLDVDRGPTIVTQPEQPRRRALMINPQLGIATERQPAEQIARFGEKRVLVLRAYSDDAARVFRACSVHRSDLMPPTIPI